MFEQHRPWSGAGLAPPGLLKEYLESMRKRDLYQEQVRACAAPKRMPLPGSPHSYMVAQPSTFVT
jgi:hypothetical protein